MNLDSNEILKDFNSKIDRLLQQKIERAVIPPLQLIAKHPDKEVTVEGFVNPQIHKIIAVMRAGIPVCFIGGSGTGKTTLAEQAAKILDEPFYCQTITAGMDESVLLGCLNPLPSGGFEYTEPPFLKAVENGGVMLLDEFDAIDENTALAINNILEFGELDLPMRTAKPKVKRHKDFKLIACANTHLNGPTTIHSGRNQLDGATISRFDGGIFLVTYEPLLEAMLCPRLYLRNAFLRLRKIVKQNMIPREISTRTLARAEKLWITGQWKTVAELIKHFTDSWNLEEQEQIPESFWQEEECKTELPDKEKLQQELGEGKDNEEKGEGSGELGQAGSEKGEWDGTTKDAQEPKIGEAVGDTIVLAAEGDE